MDQGGVVDAWLCSSEGEVFEGEWQWRLWPEEKEAGGPGSRACLCDGILLMCRELLVVAASRSCDSTQHGCLVAVRRSCDSTTFAALGCAATLYHDTMPWASIQCWTLLGCHYTMLAALGCHFYNVGRCWAATVFALRAAL